MQEMVTGSRAGDLIKLCNEPHHAGLNQTFHAAGAPALEGGGVLSELFALSDANAQISNSVTQTRPSRRPARQPWRAAACSRSVSPGPCLWSQ